MESDRYDVKGSKLLFFAIQNNTIKQIFLISKYPVILNMVMGIVARTIPQMNILMVSFVVNIGIGLLVFFAISGEFFTVAYKMYVDFFLFSNLSFI